MKQLLNWITTCLVLSFVILAICPVKAEVNYDVTHEDPEDDVQLLDDDGAVKENLWMIPLILSLFHDILSI